MPCVLDPVQRAPVHRIAVVEDEADISSLLAHCFACEGFQVTTANSAELGLDMVRRFQPDLVVLDLLLPHLSGWDVCRALRAGEATCWIPVVIPSANGDMANRAKLMEAGVDDYIVTPCSVRGVIARSQAALRRGAPPANAQEGST
jgi:DNA-binding response OmpR family regulator